MPKDKEIWDKQHKFLQGRKCIYSHLSSTCREAAPWSLLQQHQKLAEYKKYKQVSSEFPLSYNFNTTTTDWHQEETPRPVAGSQMKSESSQQSIKVIYSLLWIHLCHLKLCSLFTYPAALTVWAGFAFISLGFKVIVFLSHLSNYVTSRES